MEKDQELQLQIMVQEAKSANPPETATGTSQSILPRTTRRRNYNWWLRVSVYLFLILCGQSAALILGKLYFVKGGNSKWMATLVQLGGFPVLIPFYYFIKPKFPITNELGRNSPSVPKLAGIYLGIGLLGAVDCFLYSVGLQYLPVSTYTLLCSSQLAFNSFFSFFLNSQKFTPFIINALVLLTISSVLLVFNNESENPTGVSKLKYTIGFACTVAASAGYGLVLSLIQLAFKKVIKKETFKAVLDMLVYQQLVATSATVVGFFASGEWSDLTREMNRYQSGKVSYVMNLTWTAITWQVFAVGCVGLIFEVSSLFSNAISVLGLPVVPILAVFVFHDKMDGIKAISMVLAIWGFMSYVYQHYLDDQKSKVEDRNGNEVSKSLNTVTSREE